MHLFGILHVMLATSLLLLYFPVLDFALNLLSEVSAARIELQKLSRPRPLSLRPVFKQD